MVFVSYTKACLIQHVMNVPINKRYLPVNSFGIAVRFWLGYQASRFFLFDLILYILVNNFSVMSGEVFLG